MTEKLAEQLNIRLKGKNPQDVLSYFLKNYKDKVAFSSSFGAEDQVITEMIASLGLPCRIFTLDTGRLFQETYDLIDKTRDTYNIPIEVFFPDFKRVEEMVASKGPNLFYKSVENRKLCCGIRKTEPLKRALEGVDIWVTGIRREQSITRYGIKMVEMDNVSGILKVNPLYDWTEGQVWEYIEARKIPYNELHDKGFPSIGCLPCTRAIEPGEDVRSGRWWWEQPESKECGLHKK
jgi:phosphoadenosine phosphosulfate reductase